jgi:renalase
MQPQQDISNSSLRPPVIVVGAGLSGLIAAHSLLAQGIASVLLDKGRAPGGRLATRWLGGPTFRADSGAQFFTVRSPDFADVVHDWRRAGIVSEWCNGFLPGGDGHPRYMASGGMNTVAKYLAATLDVETQVNVASVRAVDRGWEVIAGDGRVWSSDVVLMSPPVPQSLALLDAGGIVLSTQNRGALDAVSYARCLALLIQLDGSPEMNDPGGAQLTIDDDPTFSFVADNQMKGMSDGQTMTLHVHESISTQLWDDDLAVTTSFLLDEAKRWTGRAGVRESYVHKWKFSRPTVSFNGQYLMVPFPNRSLLGFMGDGFGGAKVEGAALSGLAAAEQVAQHLRTERMNHVEGGRSLR